MREILEAIFSREIFPILFVGILFGIGLCSIGYGVYELFQHIHFEWR